MKENEQLLVNAFEQERPVVLFLGQSAWSSSEKKDSILAAVLDRLGRLDQIARGWPALIDSDTLAAENMHWLSERFNRNVQSEAMQDLLDLSWSAVFTTSIDPQLTRHLETRGRQPEVILSKGHFARVPRSRSRPPVHYLFGRSDEMTVDARVPRSRMELRQRAVHAADMVNRVAETTTPLGLLVLEGYVPGCDWLAIDDLLAPISMTGEIQILWFGLSSVPNSEFFNELLKKGVLHIDERRLVDVVAELNARKVLGLERIVSSEEPGTVSLANGDFIVISPSLRLRVEASAAVVDDTWTSFLPPIKESEQEAFQRFHGGLGSSRTLVEGIARGFAIRRDFESKLRERFEVALKKHGDSNRVIVLHGQSGTGKSVAIARLAYELRKEVKVPVLYSNGRIPQATDIDEFCIEAEQAKAAVTVILCDSNQAPNRYYDLANSLRSRGRRIVVIGTSYRFEISKDKLTSNPDIVEAQSEVSPQERSSLQSLVKNFGGSSLVQSSLATTKKTPTYLRCFIVFCRPVGHVLSLG
ncbi:hypothetical protein SAMN05444354_102194 [Stigmatella aurantiaca]|uniref:AAA+ ATPase domain-containing protein n=1 Tax=Stigmatella aurantiaca TaxID=41 RepID=A0A1H7JIM0_STIAU|nr:hypothetical protein [Stigmatella aurantiaca]SEK73285.1 hypothetical protein SAMN05444354_102194 [Stigmatella aurantiaca]